MSTEMEKLEQLLMQSFEVFNKVISDPDAPDDVKQAATQSYKDALKIYGMANIRAFEGRTTTVLALIEELNEVSRAASESNYASALETINVVLAQAREAYKIFKTSPELA